MSLETVCRLCLATKVPMHALAESSLKNIYEKLTNISLNSPHRPLMACYICYSQLKKCKNLFTKSVRADRLLTQILHSGEIITEEYIATIDREAYQLNDTLIVTPVELLSAVSSEEDLVEEIHEESVQSPYMIDVDVNCKLEESNELDGEQPDNLKDSVHVYVKCEMLEVDTQVQDVNIKREEHIDANTEQNKSDDGENMTVDMMTVVLEATDDVEHDKSDGVALTKKCKQNTKTQHRIPGEQKIRGKQKKRIIKYKKLSNTNVSPYTSKNTKDASVTQLIKDTLRPQTATSRGNVSNDCTDFDDNTSKHLKNTIYRLLEHIQHKDNIKNVQTIDEGSSQCSTSRQKGSTSRQKGSTSRPKCFKTSVERAETGNQTYRFVCDICQRKFNYKRNLIKHLKIHSREKTCVCTICQRVFNSELTLTRHYKKHVDGKMFECEICSRKFTKQSGLNKHLETHNPEKMFKCALCQRSFKHDTTLKRHFKTHWRETI